MLASRIEMLYGNIVYEVIQSFLEGKQQWSVVLISTFITKTKPLAVVGKR